MFGQNLSTAGGPWLQRVEEEYNERQQRRPADRPVRPVPEGQVQFWTENKDTC